ncbi:MAG TPA: hypothetical protein VIN71_01995 [Pseudomonadales bacterium]
MTPAANQLGIFIILASFATPAMAYLDPGAGSFVLQMLIAGIVGALFTIKLYWYRFKAFVAGLFGKTIDNPMEEKPADPADDDTPSNTH